jgi:hypothetical protein
MKGWRATRGDNKTGGRWFESESEGHINGLEIKAGFLGLQSLCSEVCDKHIHMRFDNTTSVAYVNHFGGSHSKVCNEIARQIWEWCIARNIWLTATYIPGSDNVEADKQSRVFHDQTQWQLDPEIFRKITTQLGVPDIDLFASRLNCQTKQYVSWMPDPGALAVDAFAISWSKYYCYIFPPFSLMNRVLQKFNEDEAEGILVAPMWKTQTWFPRLRQLATRPPMLLPWRPLLVRLPYKLGEEHPLGPRLHLAAWHLSAKH